MTPSAKESCRYASLGIHCQNIPEKSQRLQESSCSSLFITLCSGSRWAGVNSVGSSLSGAVFGVGEWSSEDHTAVFGCCWAALTQQQSFLLPSLRAGWRCTGRGWEETQPLQGTWPDLREERRKWRWLRHPKEPSRVLRSCFRGRSKHSPADGKRWINSWFCSVPRITSPNNNFVFLN